MRRNLMTYFRQNPEAVVPFDHISVKGTYFTDHVPADNLAETAPLLVELGATGIRKWDEFYCEKTGIRWDDYPSLIVDGIGNTTICCRGNKGVSSMTRMFEVITSDDVRYFAEEHGIPQTIAFIMACNEENYYDYVDAYMHPNIHHIDGLLSQDLDTCKDAVMNVLNQNVILALGVHDMQKDIFHLAKFTYERINEDPFF
ncbi:MAG: hypothetical protein Q4E47_01030 [Candidatus Saccharibacteria bacterium]|nr:hypothetical protein [Candidatus Saccharibacteria bacterium]